MKFSLLRVFSVTALCSLIALSGYGQKLSKYDKDGAKDMLRNVKSEIKGQYFDSKYKGVDIDTVFAAANDKIDSATSLNQAFGIIAQAVLALDDSHTNFYPPSRDLRVDYGWRMQMVGDRCLVTAVRPGSDAEKQGLKIGDQISKIEGFTPSRKELWKINYYYNVISPRAGLNLLVTTPGTDKPRELNVASKQVRKGVIVTGEQSIRDWELSTARTIENRFVRVGNTTAWQMPTFSQDPSMIDGIMTGRASQSPNLILDLRGNGGGYVVTLEALAGYFVDQNTKIADYKGRQRVQAADGEDKRKGCLPRTSNRSRRLAIRIGFGTLCSLRSD